MKSEMTCRLTRKANSGKGGDCYIGKDGRMSRGMREWGCESGGKKGEEVGTGGQRGKGVGVHEQRGGGGVGVRAKG